ncbi:NmrA family transcriptional regulator [Kitasatospora sp. NPDC051170]|uniref:NmrA family transcriptional regulator n=1 Tax=Kitasatospora sp. NPDC051170 TaxID=3364056 RepID=UPI0037B6F6CC
MTENGVLPTDAGAVLVVGGTGKTGRRVATRLIERGYDVRIGSRSAAVPFDWHDESTWLPALDGVTAAYLTYYPDLALPGAVEHVRDFSRLAAERGVGRLVLLSGRGEEGAEAGERAVTESGVPAWTIVRCAWFNQNFDESFFLDPVLAGEVALPVGDALEPFVDAEDIADVAVAALTEPGHAGELYELTGPRLLSFADAVGELALATGRPIRFTPVTAEEYRAVLEAEGLPGDLVELFTLVLDGRNAFLGDGVERALGRKAKDFADYAREAAATGVFNA